MAKTKTKFVCCECGCESPKWLGKCPECDQWNTFVEELEQKATTPSGRGAISTAKPQKLLEIDYTTDDRMSTGLGELDRVLGGGIVAGSLVLVGGDPGIGKSTLLLQLSEHIGRSGKKTALCVRGRIKCTNKNESCKNGCNF